MKIFAHRGYHNAGLLPNTLAAFKQAVLLGVDGIETDIRASADGAAILFHDRCLGDGTPVCSLTHRQLNELVGYDVPTLADALENVPDILWNLEIKSFEGLEAALRVLNAAKPKAEFFVTSFVHKLVVDATEHLRVDGGLLIAHAPLDCPSLGTARNRIRTLVWDFETVNDKLVREAKMGGFDSMIYGPISKDEHRAAKNMGIQALITDFPQYGRLD
jgi:glycerophosphoryl diester phosphodiesterase